jgi:hypothetical protein
VREAHERDTLFVGQRRRPRPLERRELPPITLGLRERLLPGALERAGDEAVLGLAGVVLAAEALGLVLGPLEREPLLGKSLVMFALKLGNRSRRGGDAGRADRLKEGVGDGAIESAAAERLAGPLGTVQVAAAHAGVAR